VADNLTTQTTLATIPSATIIATDDVAGVHYQRMKLADGADGGTALIGGDATNGLDVDVTRLPALVAGSANIGDVDVLTVPAPLSTTGGGTEATALRVTLANDSTGLVSVDDNAGTLTVDAPVGTPVNVQIGNATISAGVVDETGASAVDAFAVGGGTPNDSVDSGNPVKIGGRAQSTAPTAVVNGDRVNAHFGLTGSQATFITSYDGNNIDRIQGNSDGLADTNSQMSVGGFMRAFNGTSWDRVRSAPGVTGAVAIGGLTAADATLAAAPVTIGARASTALPAAVSADAEVVNLWANRSGALVVASPPHTGLNSDPFNQIHEGNQYTTTQTSAVLVAGGASEKLVITDIQIQVFGTNAGDLIVYYGTAAFARGTNRAVFDGTFKPSATLAPGVVMKGPFVSGTNGDDILVTTTNNLNVTISVWYYVVV
jgi:hypothetical protein